MKRRLTGAMLITLFAFLLAGPVPALAFDHSANEATMLRLVNHARTSRGLHAVKIVASLDRAALLHSRDMIGHDYFSHSSRGGATLAVEGAERRLPERQRSSVTRCIAYGSSVPGHAGEHLQGLDGVEFPPADHPDRSVA